MGKVTSGAMVRGWPPKQDHPTPSGMMSAELCPDRTKLAVLIMVADKEEWSSKILDECYVVIGAAPEL